MKYLFFIIAFISTFSHANSIVVKNKGGVSALPYYEAIGLTKEPPSSPVTIQRPTRPNKVDESAFLPVQSKLLNPGRFSARQMKMPGFSPIFLIGNDSLSKRWLAENQTKLKLLGAMGLVVQVDNIQQLHQIRSIAPELKLSPVSGDDIAKRLRLQHYPVLITENGISQ
ncbi:integrating conjugative element protein [Zophobihabitans entericus]|uniref:Integrating conjugative element protein n=1 Tax=Zophobihabitans entericus TaxID=1635327 RepID=A0A6G9IEB8_9GAMM|nr:integrating conjugative element protein [Zophobihabitans entericus]QIQ22162.1 integrating conjugative element protein [Zophobihabitans entericus]